MCSDPSAPSHAAALDLWQRGYQLQSRRDLVGAERLYRESIDLHPTAEAWTFLGWVASWRGELDLAVERCRCAIEVDPSFGNPYNDIGAYLIELGRHEEAISWLQRAINAPRYEARVFPHVNLGRVFERLGRFAEAVEHYSRALELQPRHGQALQALERLLPRRNGHVKPPEACR
jgi:Tfp pilus assembly protein PilF